MKGKEECVWLFYFILFLAQGEVVMYFIFNFLSFFFPSMQTRTTTKLQMAEQIMA